MGLKPTISKRHGWIVHSYEIPQSVEIKGRWTGKFGVLSSRSREADGVKVITEVIIIVIKMWEKQA